jgi:hypothetical protein
MPDHHLSEDTVTRSAEAFLRVADFTPKCFATRRAVFQYESPFSAQLILDERIGLLTICLDGPVTPDIGVRFGIGRGFFSLSKRV